MIAPPLPAVFVWLVAKLRTARLSEPARLWLYSLAGVVLAGLVLAGVITDDWSTIVRDALGVLLLTLPGAELARAGVYAPATLLAAGVLDHDPPRHAAHRHTRAGGVPCWCGTDHARNGQRTPTTELPRQRGKADQ